jgi:5,10-methenyltetrahydrofolate synthetase
VNASVVLAYEPIVAVEIPFVHELMRRHPEKQWYFPRVLPERDMEFIDQHDDVFFPGSEPICVIVPCMAVDRRGVRLGKGGGYYDHFILKHPHVREGTMVVVPDFAFLPQVPKEVHDMTVAHVIVAKER